MIKSSLNVVYYTVSTALVISVSTLVILIFHISSAKEHLLEENTVIIAKLERPLNIKKKNCISIYFYNIRNMQNNAINIGRHNKY